MSLNHNSKFRRNWLWISLVLLAVGIGLGLLLPTGMQLAREADERADAMYDAYCEDRFDVALTAVSDYIAYLEKHERKIARYRKTDSMLSGAHLQAGFMLLHTEDVTRAQEHLSAAYEYLQKYRLATITEPVDKNEFVDLAISNGERIDRHCDVIWMRETSLNTNTVEVIKAKLR